MLVWMWLKLLLHIQTKTMIIPIFFKLLHFIVYYRLHRAFAYAYNFYYHSIQRLNEQSQEYSEYYVYC